MKKITSKKGFTLIEMLVVIAIIAILVAIIVPTVQNSTTKAKAAADAATLRALTAEATIDYLDDDAINNGPYKMNSKVLGSEQTVSFVDKGTEIVAYFGQYYTVETLSKAATTGKLDDAKTTTSPGTALTVTNKTT